MQPWHDDAELFRHRRAAAVQTWQRWILGILLFLGVQSVLYFGLWWFKALHVNNIFLFMLLSFATWYGVFRIMVGWYNVFHIEQPDPVDAPPGLRVAIFTTSSPGEPYEMFVRTLAAPRETPNRQTPYLPDATRDRGFRRLT